ncbi:MAG: hypothetical protein E7099_01755 [Mediterranea massiliensis]|nr:hypothetical protein [Mediterranea massiliensis]
MEHLFIYLYRFFEKRRTLMYLLLIGSSLLFTIFGLQVTYEEDISRLLPQTEKATQSGLAFSNLRVKDKVFLQFIGKEGKRVDTRLVDSFIEGLLEKDTTNRYIDNILYRIDDDLMINGLDYLLMNLPTFIDTTTYKHFDTYQTKEAIDKQMAQNKEWIENDEDGSKTNLVGQDPLALRMAMLLQGKSLIDGMGGYTLVDGHLLTPDSTVVLAFLSPDFKAFDSKAGNQLICLLEDEIKQFETSHPEVEVLFHGAAVQSVFNSRQIKKDLAMTLTASLLIICIVIGYCFRNKSTLVMLLSPILYGTFFALTCIYWIKGSMSIMALGIGGIVLGVALSYCLHVLTHYKYVSQPIQVLKEQTTPVILGCLTTIGAFMGLLLTQSDLLKDFGLFASLALIGTTLFCLIFLPHFFHPQSNRRSEKAFAWLNRISNYPLEKKRWLLIAISLICLISFYTCRLVTFDSDLKNIGYHNPKVLRSNQLYAEKNQQGYTSIYYATAASSLDSALIYNHNLLSTCDSLQTAGVIKSYGKTSTLFIPIEEQERRILAWQQYWNEERINQVRQNLKEAADKYRLPSEMFEPFFIMIESEYTPSSLYEADVLPESLLCNFIEESNDKFMVFTPVLMSESNKWIVGDAISALPNSVVIDPFYYTGNMVEIINNDFNVVLFISSIFVFIVLLLSFRNLWISLLAFMPMFLSWYIVQGIMGLFGLQFNLINIIISSFIFGIGVDYSIFVTDGLLAQTKQKQSHLLTYHKTAIFFSAFVLLTVVISLLFATHPAISSIGISTLIGMGATVLITYTLQPYLYKTIWNRLKK